MAQTDNNQGPGLGGIFLNSYPAYSYHGPIDMRYALFTPSALNRMTNQEPIFSNKKIAQGKNFIDQAKFLNDIYGLVKNTVSIYNPEASQDVAPLILTDQTKPGWAAWYNMPKHQIFQPVYDVIPESGYYEDRSTEVVSLDNAGVPTQHSDYFVSEKGRRIPVDRSAIPHEVGHSLDQVHGTAQSQHDKDLWNFVTKDWYLYPREYIEQTTKPEAFAEYFADAMRSGYANKLPQLKELYQQTSQYLPYSLEDSYDIPISTQDGNAVNALISDMVKSSIDMSGEAAESTGKTSKRKEAAANYEGSRDAKKYIEAMFNTLGLSQGENNLTAKELLDNALAVQRAKEHLDFLNYFLVPSPEE